MGDGGRATTTTILKANDDEGKAKWQGNDGGAVEEQ